jgi:hypothetical protein
MFIRAELSRPSTSWAGVIAIAAGDASPVRIRLQLGSFGSSPVRSRRRRGSERHQPTVVSVSWVPV